MKFKLEKQLLEYQFEEYNENYLKQILQLGVSKKMATILTGNNSVVMRSNPFQEFLKENPEIKILKTESENNLYYSEDKVKNDYHFFNLVCNEILNFRIFDFRFIALTKYAEGSVTFELSKIQNGKIKSYEVTFIDITKIKNNVENIKNCIIINNDVILGKKYSNLLENNLFVNNNKYIFNENGKTNIYEGTSFFVTNWFNNFLENKVIERNVDIEDFKENSQMRLEKNNFDFGNKILVDSENEYNYLNSLNGVLNQEMIDFYNRYGNQDELLINLYFDKQVDMFKVKQSKINSFREFELGFALNYFKNNEIKNKTLITDSLNEDLNKEPEMNILPEDDLETDSLNEDLNKEPEMNILPEDDLETNFLDENLNKELEMNILPEDDLETNSLDEGLNKEPEMNILPEDDLETNSLDEDLNKESETNVLPEDDLENDSLDEGLEKESEMNVLPEDNLKKDSLDEDLEKEPEMNVLPEDDLETDSELKDSEFNNNDSFNKLLNNENVESNHVNSTNVNSTDDDDEFLSNILQEDDFAGIVDKTDDEEESIEQHDKALDMLKNKLNGNQNKESNKENNKKEELNFDNLLADNDFGDF